MGAPIAAANRAAATTDAKDAPFSAANRAAATPDAKGAPIAAANRAAATTDAKGAPIAAANRAAATTDAKGAPTAAVGGRKDNPGCHRRAHQRRLAASQSATAVSDACSSGQSAISCLQHAATAAAR